MRLIWPSICLAIALCQGCDTAGNPGATSDRLAAPSSSESAEGQKSQSGKSSASVSRTNLKVVPAFSDVAPEVGIEFQFHEDRIPGRYLLPEVMGGGAAWIDVDRDGWLDLAFVNGTVLDPKPDSPVVPGHRLYRNRSGVRFTEVSNVAGLDLKAYGQGIAVADFNADGFDDVFLSSYGPEVLLSSNGDGTFSDVTAESTIGDPLWSTSAAWVDVNDDQLVDLFCANYMDVTLANNQVCYYGEKPGYCGPGKYNGLTDTVWLNDGNGHFHEGSKSLGLNQKPSKGLAVAVIDLDRDLRPEIYVANDMEANFLYTRTENDSSQNTTPWREIGSSSGTAVGADGMNEASMGIAAADYDSDGLPDLYLTHYYQMKNTLYRNLGGLMFEDDSLRTGVAATSFAYLGFGTIPIDFDQDRRFDVFIANGHVLGPAVEPNAMSPQLLHNTGTGFQDVSTDSGPYFTDAWIGRGVAGSDYDNDGDLDIAVSHIDRPAALLQNSTKRSASFVGMTLMQPQRELPLGARVIVTSSAGSQEQTVSGGGSYLSANDARLLFPVDGEVISVEITWPDGTIQNWTDLPIDCYLLIQKGSTPLIWVP